MTATSQARREEFERLAVPTLDMLYRQAIKYTNSPEDAQDLVQDTIERGFKAFDSFQRGTNIEAWLTTILRNTYFSQYQKARRRPQRANDSTGEYDDWDIYEASGHQAAGLRSAEEQYLDAYAPDEIVRALQALSPERRQVFIDTAIDGKSYQQVADEQGIKIGTVMSRLNRARTQLKAALGPYAQDHGYRAGGRADQAGRPGPSAQAGLPGQPGQPAPMVDDLAVAAGQAGWDGRLPGLEPTADLAQLSGRPRKLSPERTGRSVMGDNEDNKDGSKKNGRTSPIRPVEQVRS